jgi:hypothetical protein
MEEDAVSYVDIKLVGGLALAALCVKRQAPWPVEWRGCNGNIDGGDNCGNRNDGRASPFTDHKRSIWLTVQD